MQLVKQPPQPIPLASITSEAEETRNNLATDGLAIKQVTNAAENTQARDVAVAIRNHLKEVEASRTQLTKPLLDGQRMLKKVADDHVAPLVAILDRLERLATVFAVEEQARAAAELEARMSLLKEAKTADEANMVINELVLNAQKAQGQQLRNKLCWEVTDINALVKARPDLCKIEPKGSAIQSCCVPDMPNLPPGLKLWWDTKTVFTTR